MATEEDLKKAESEEDAEEASSEEASSDLSSRSEARTSHRPSPDAASPEDAPDDAEEGDGEREAVDAQAPVQLGYQRYVYAAYMAGALLSAFLAAKIGHVAWYRLGQWKPELGEPKDELVYVVAAVLGVLIALYYWRKPSARQYANEVAEELSKVTWPSRKEVTNSTTVVVFTTLFATVFFALMDRFWSFITDKIYSF